MSAGTTSLVETPICTLADIAATVAHFVSEDGRYITNQRIPVSGDGF